MRLIYQTLSPELTTTMTPHHYLSHIEAAALLVGSQGGTITITGCLRKAVVLWVGKKKLPLPTWKQVDWQGGGNLHCSPSSTLLPKQLLLGIAALALVLKQ